MKFLTILSLLLCSTLLSAQQNPNPDKFAQIDPLLPTPNVYRTASGAPGPEYWQQRADYDISVVLDDENKTLSGTERITYFNNAPIALEYLWVQLDQNIRAPDSDSYWFYDRTLADSLTENQFAALVPTFEGGVYLEYVQDTDGKPLNYTVNKTMMRIDLPRPLVSGAAFSFDIKWHYNINDRSKVDGRSGYEYFAEHGNALYTIAQFYPRMAQYNDHDGWQNAQFYGQGEFALSFGNFEVEITVPADHIVAATGALQNGSEVLTAAQRQRLQEAKTADRPVLIVTEQEARENEKEGTTATKTWKFKAENVRDFAFASSRKFIWDAQGVKFGDRTVMAMSVYPKEANPLWEKYSTPTVIHTLKTYSKYTFDYPWPVAISVNAANIGMEYPMICFNFGRSNPDGTYSEQMKYGVIGVIIHEVGHNFFPMIVNSDERQWMWLDEGLNSFLQYLTQREFEYDFPERTGEPRSIVPYMAGDRMNMYPIMVNAESIIQRHYNGYFKPVVGLNILRETIMGRELFDFAFKTYANRWKFKHPEPADFFRTMEDASAVDLDWFWRGWFYSTEYTDQALTSVREYIISKNVAQAKARFSSAKYGKSISDLRDEEAQQQTLVEQNEFLRDEFTRQRQVDKNLSQVQRNTTDSVTFAYEVQIENEGELVMPVILQFEFEDGSSEIQNLPVQVWMQNSRNITKMFIFEKRVTGLALDPYQQTVDINLNNNFMQVTGAPKYVPVVPQR